MPSYSDIIDLLKAISDQGEDAINLPEITKMIKRISSTTIRVHIELDYNGREWHTKVPMTDITASEWIARMRPSEKVKE